MNKQTAKKKLISCAIKYIQAGNLSYEDLQDALKSVRTATGLHRPGKRRKAPAVFTNAELQRLFAACDNPDDELALRLLYESAARIEEFTRLQPRHFDFEKMVVEFDEAKGNKRRWVPLPPSLRLPLMQRCQASKQFLFDSPRGGAFTERYWQLRIKKIARAAGFTDEQLIKCHPHTFRHTRASNWLNAGMNLREVQILLGHDDIATTTIYTHCAIGHIAQKVQGIEVAA